MPTPFQGEIRMLSGTNVPSGWALCNGQFMPIAGNQSLFSLLGTTYGGDGVNNFALPDLRGRVALHLGNGHTQGEKAGQQAVTLSISQLPEHLHSARASGSTADANAAAGNLLAVSQANIYLNPNDVSPALTTLHPDTVTTVGGSQPHQNMQPFNTVNFIIALQGVYPS